MSQMRRIAAPRGGLGLAARRPIGLTQAGRGEGGAPPKRPSAPPRAQRERGGPRAPRAGLHRQSARLLGGGRPAFERRVAGLKGYPVVVNKWASWCGPCRTEFPIFQSEAVKQGKRVAFVGVNAGDSRDPARRFLRATPLPFPSYVDPSEEIAKSIRAPANYPIPVFFDRRGRLVYIHQGGYRQV